MRKLQMLKPRLKELEPRIKMLSARKPRTLKDKQQSNGRTLALDGAAWRKLRKLILEDEPLCRYCYAHGRINMATDVDHISNDPSDNRRENLQALCHECHSRKTASDMGYNVSMGCDMSGAPLDPNHAWNAAQKPGKSSQTDGCQPPGKSLFNANRENEP